MLDLVGEEQMIDNRSCSEPNNEVRKFIASHILYFFSKQYYPRREEDKS